MAALEVSGTAAGPCHLSLYWTPRSRADYEPALTAASRDWRAAAAGSVIYQRRSAGYPLSLNK